VQSSYQRVTPASIIHQNWQSNLGQPSHLG